MMYINIKRLFLVNIFFVDLPTLPIIAFSRRWPNLTDFTNGNWRPTNGIGAIGHVLIGLDISTFSVWYYFILIFSSFKMLKDLL